METESNILSIIQDENLSEYERVFRMRAIQLGHNVWRMSNIDAPEYMANEKFSFLAACIPSWCAIFDEKLNEKQELSHDEVEGKRSIAEYVLSQAVEQAAVESNYNSALTYLDLLIEKCFSTTSAKITIDQFKQKIRPQ